MRLFKRIIIISFIMFIIPCMSFASNNKSIIDVQMMSKIIDNQILYKNEELDLSSIKMRILYDNLTYDDIDANDSRIKVDGFDSSLVGPQNVTLGILDRNSYRKIFDFNVTILNKENEDAHSINEERLLKISAPLQRPKYRYVEAFYINKMPSAGTVFHIGDEIDFSDMEFYIQFSDSGYGTILTGTSNGISFEYDSNYIGTQNVTVKYVYYNEGITGRKTRATAKLEFQITILDNNEVSMTNMEVYTLPYKIEYKLNEELDLTGGTIKLSYSDNSYEIIDMSDPAFTVFNFNSDIIGSKLIVIQKTSDIITHNNTSGDQSGEISGDISGEQIYNNSGEVIESGEIYEIDTSKLYVVFTINVTDIEEVNPDETIIVADSKNYRINSYDLNNPIIDELYDLNTNLPSQFNLTTKFDLIVHKQGILGLCALFATNKGQETNFYYKTGKYYDLSNRFIDYMSSPLLYGVRTVGSLDDNIEGDGVGFTSEIPLMEMYGNVLEKDVPYRDYTDSEAILFKDKETTTKLNSCIYFSRVSNYDSEYDKFVKIIKNHIMQYGSVYICIPTPVNNTLLNVNTNGYYISADDTSYNSLHAVSIVGWDDNYSKNNFINKPENDGAWIVMNSWGSEWGDNGCFYISYDSYFVNMLGIVDTDYTHPTNEYTYAKEYLSTDYSYTSATTSRYYYIEFNKNSDVEYLENIIIPNDIKPNGNYINIYIVNDYDGVDLSNMKYVGKLDDTTTFSNTNLILDEPYQLTGDKFLIIIECPHGSYLPGYYANNSHTYYSSRKISENKRNSELEIPIFVYTISEEEYIEKSNSKTILNIEVNKLPTNSTITAGDSLDLKGGSIKVNYEDGSNEIIEMTNTEVGSYGVTPTSPIGANTVTVVYKNNKASFDITINEKNNSSGGSGGSSSGGGSSGSSSGGGSSGGGGGGGSSSTVNTYKITVSTSTGGTISPSTSKVEEGDNITFSITPKDGYIIKDVIVDGKSLGVRNTYIFENVKATHTISAKFEKGTYQESGEKSGDTSGENTSNSNSTKTPTSNGILISNFKDVKPNDWFYEAIKFAIDNNLFNGMSATEFGPNIPMTRGMMVTVLYRLSGAVEKETSSFYDVPKDSYYSYAINWANKNKIVFGVGENKFAPDNTITRQDLATIVARYISRFNIEIKTTNNETIAYTDAKEISSYAVANVELLSSKGLMQGKTGNRFDPKGLTTRAEVATLLMRVINNKIQ